MLTLMLIATCLQDDSGSTPVRKPAADAPAVRSLELSDPAQKFIQDIALIAIPAEFHDDKKWGNTVRVQSGLDVRLDGARVRTNRRWKDVKHGLWQKYHVQLIDPERRLNLRIANVVKSPGKPYQFDVVCSARLRTEARWQDWQLGIPVLRISAESVADVTLKARCELAVEFDHTTFPPAVQLRPTVRSADVRLGKFQVRRVSHMKGRVAEQLSGSIKAVLRRELARRRERLPTKINKKLQRKEDELRVSFGDWLSFSSDKQVPSEKKVSGPFSQGKGS